MPAKRTIIINVGDRFGRLVVTETGIKHPDKNGHSIQYCRVLCDCGKESEVRKKNMFYGIARSCGCLHDEIVTARNYKHGGKRSRIYNMWCGIRARCKNPNDKRYKDYGGRGIKICSEWDNSFACFRDWAQFHGYADDLTIERVDVHGDYTPENCCFIPMSAQAGNTRKNVHITCFGETKTASEWSRDPRCIVPIGTLTRRIRTGWVAEHALTQPADARRRKINPFKHSYYP